MLGRSSLNLVSNREDNLQPKDVPIRMPVMLKSLTLIWKYRITKNHVMVEPRIQIIAVGVRFSYRKCTEAEFNLDPFDVLFGVNWTARFPISSRLYLKYTCLSHLSHWGTGHVCRGHTLAKPASSSWHSTMLQFCCSCSSPATKTPGKPVLPLRSRSYWACPKLTAIPGILLTSTAILGMSSQMSYLLTFSITNVRLFFVLSMGFGGVFPSFVNSSRCWM